MAITPITALPTPPNRSMPPATFIPTADAFLAALPAMVTQINAAIAALNALLTASFAGSSVTSNTIAASGTKTWTTQASLGFQPGQTIVLANTASPVNQMTGVVQSYDNVAGTLVVVVQGSAGSGTFAAWSISLSAPVSGVTKGQVAGLIFALGG